MLVVQIGVRVHPRVRSREGKGKKEGHGSNEVLALLGLVGSTPEHDYVIRSRSRDRSFSA